MMTTFKFMTLLGFQTLLKIIKKKLDFVKKNL